MKKILLVLILVYLSTTVFSQKVSNVTFFQEGKNVKICYYLSAEANVRIYLSTDGGRSFGSSPITALTGDIGKVSQGSHCAVWNVLADRDKLQGNNICFKVVAIPLSKNETFTINGISFTMVYVEGGTFTMGATSEQGSDAYDDEKPAHQVTLSSYYIGETEVTQALWQAVMGNNPSWFVGDNLPVENVSYEDVQDFITKLNQKTGKKFRLPTEAEWEFAARGGNKSKGYKYSGSNNLNDVAWYDGNSNSKTHIVKTKQANELGLYDMSGNVLEWCSDWGGDYSSSSQTNPKGPNSGSTRVWRGGSWFDIARDCRVSYRNYDIPSDRGSAIGFRLALAR